MRSLSNKHEHKFAIEDEEKHNEVAKKFDDY